MFSRGQIPQSALIGLDPHISEPSIVSPCCNSMDSGPRVDESVSSLVQI